MEKKNKNRKEKPVFNHKEETILRTIGKYRRYMTINEISSESKISWATCNKYIQQMLEDGILSKQTVDEDGKEVIDQMKAKYRVDFDKLYKDPNY